MPLIKCSMCERDISSNAISCPHCGEPIKKDNIQESINDSYNIILLDGGNHSIRVIQKIRDFKNCSVKEAKHIFDDVPSIVINNINYSDANNFKKLFENLGAKIDIIKNNDVLYVDNCINNQNSIFIAKCPTCSSSNILKISGISKAGSVVAFGIFSIGKISKTFECKSCGYRW